MSATGAESAAPSGVAPYDEFVFTDGDELWDRLHNAHRRFAALVSVTPSKHPLPGSRWTAGEVATHVLTVLRRYTRRDISDPAGLVPDREALAEQNEADLAAYEGVGIREVIDLLWQELADIETLLPRNTDLHRKFPFHADQEVDAAGMIGNLIGEFLVHGRDVARSRGKEWEIGSRNAALILNLSIQAVPGFVSPEAPGDLKVEIRTPETSPWILDLADGAVVSRRAERREWADVKVFTRAEPLLLNTYGRIGMLAMTMQGATVVGGRRPWRLARLPASFEVP